VPAGTVVAQATSTAGTPQTRQTAATRTPPPATTVFPGINSLQTQGILLIAVAVVGLALLAGLAWRMLRTPPGPGAPGDPVG
jgi:hypothetical protein